MSGNLPFGFGAPDEGSQPFDMSQLGEMLQQLGRLMQSGGGDGAVNWDLARDTARKALAGAGDPSVSEAERRAVAEAVSLSQVWLDPACTFPASSADGQCWSRSEWLEGTFPAWQRIVAPIAEHVQAAMQPQGDQLPPELSALLPEGMPPEAAAMLAPLLGMARQMGSAMFGMQVGQGLAALAAEVVGAADVGVPLTDDYRPVLLPRNVEAFGEGLEIPLDEVRLYLALRECAHQRLFAHVPWLAARLEGAIDAYARGIRVDTDRLGEALREIDPGAMQDPARLQEALGSDMFELVDTPEQQAALARLETLLALIEGWVTDVVSEASAAALPHADRLGEAVRRRRAAGGPAEKTFASLVGLELRPRALREAAQVWATLREQEGIEGRDGLWAHPDLLPDHEDLQDPQAFVARVGEDPFTGLDEPGDSAEHDA
ncbi:MAG: zinc-dependent metalloprotease [Candidatus Nanopelagicales bacterium]